MSKVFLEDARNLKKKIRRSSLDVTITSPPYFDMKDYGHFDQIGFGQDYTTYLKDLKGIFEDIYDATKDTGSLWVIIDTFKRNGVVVPLPFDFAREISATGWRLQDIIVWKKDKTVPWSKKGTTRKIFEYVLFFSKGQDFKYYSERAREITDLKEWWVRYPERYSPSGKSLEEIWEFSIPTQGSWGDNYIRHFCPLPEELVRRIITLTTDEGDTVFDPFSGSGTVPAQAAFMKRKYYGFELNREYINMFECYLKNNLKSKLDLYAASKVSVSEELFRRKIIDLRILKFGRVLSKKLKSYGINISKILIERSRKELFGKHEIASAKYLMLCDRSYSEIIRRIEEITSVPPLSKFGISCDFSVQDNVEAFVDQLPECELFVYSATNTHQYSAKFFKRNTMSSAIVGGFIFSPIDVSVNEAIYRSSK